MAIEQEETVSITLRPTWGSRLIGLAIIAAAVCGFVFDPEFYRAGLVVGALVLAYALLSAGPAGFLRMMFGLDELSLTGDQLIIGGRFRFTRRIPRQLVCDLYVDRWGSPRP